MKWVGPALACGGGALGGPTEGERGLSPTQRLLSPESQPWEKQFPQNLTVKISRVSGILGEVEENWKPRCLL